MKQMAKKLSFTLNVENKEKAKVLQALIEVFNSDSKEINTKKSKK